MLHRTFSAVLHLIHLLLSNIIAVFLVSPFDPGFDWLHAPWRFNCFFQRKEWLQFWIWPVQKLIKLSMSVMKEPCLFSRMTFTFVYSRETVVRRSRQFKVRVIIVRILSNVTHENQRHFSFTIIITSVSVKACFILQIRQGADLMNVPQLKRQSILKLTGMAAWNIWIITSVGF